MALKLSPKTVTGFLHTQNKNSCDWGWQGQLAYGSQNLVVVVDPTTVQVIQALDKHKGYVVKVKWGKENYYHDLASPYSLRLASADYNGKIIVWNVAQASVLSEFSDSSKPVADMEWVRSQDVSQDLLAVLHPPYSLVLWNAATGTKLWKKSYTDNLLTFSFDPFDPCKLAFLGQDSILFVDDFSLSKTPSSNGRKYFISAPSSQGGVSQSSSSDKLSDKKNRSTIRIVSSMLVGGDATKRSGSEEPEAVNECLQLLYHKACRHHLVLLYAREILVLDLQINQTVGIIPLERNGSPFAQLISMQQRDVFVCLHENGGVTLRMRRKAKEMSSSAEFGDETPTQSMTGVSYDMKCQSDSVRLTRHVKVYGASTCPVSENKVAIFLSDGRILIWQLTTVDHQWSSERSPQSPLFTPGLPVKADLFPLLPKLNLDCSVPYPKTTLGDLITPAQSQSMKQSMSQSLKQSMNQSQQSDAGEIGRGRHGVQLKFVLCGLLHGLAAPPCIIKMCPPLTTKNWAVYQPLLAVGSGTGNVQVYNMSGGYMTREFSIHSCAVRGIEWCSLHSFMSFASSGPSSNGLVKNEITLTDIQSGRSTPIRTNRDEESSIEMIRVSHLKQYFVVVFKDKPFELWDLKTCTMLRQMPRHFPKVTALEWSPSPGAKKKSLQDASVLSASSMDLSVSTPSEPPARGFQPKPADTGPTREHFVFTDTEGLLYHFLIEGNMVKDGSKIPPDGSMSTISSIAWKGETLVLGDVEGNLNIWDLKNRISKAVPTNKGWIKRMKFAPGRGNMKLVVLHTDSVEIWDAKSVELMSSLRTPKDVAKVTDADWVASDKPALACADGCLRVMDLHFKTGCSPLHDYQLQDSLFSPHLLAPKAALTLKSILQHQPWNDTYVLSLEENDQNTEICALVNEQLQLIDSDVKEYLMNCHFGTAHRCLFTARLFGDESDVSFWSVALHYMRAEKAEPSSQKMHHSSSHSTGDLFVPNTPVRETRDLLDLDEGHNASMSKSWSFVKDNPLESCFDVLCDNATFQRAQLERVSLHDSKRATAEHTHACAENLLLLGQADRAVQLLLETDAAHPAYYVDSLRACLVASIRSSGASQSTIKLVATNLIANGKLSEGVQLLCLIDKGLDACRYLQTYGEWHQAAWLAKATLEHGESKEVMKRWAEHLSTPIVNQKSLALLVMLSLAQFDKVIEMLYSMRQFERAALFIEACLEFDVLPKSADNTSVCEAVRLEYARYLLSLGNRKAAEFYCRQAGDKGALLLTEISAAFSP